MLSKFSKFFKILRRLVGFGFVQGDYSRAVWCVARARRVAKNVVGVVCFLNNAWRVGLITAWRIWIFARGLKENLKICFLAKNLARMASGVGWARDGRDLERFKNYGGFFNGVAVWLASVA